MKNKNLHPCIIDRFSITLHSGMTSYTSLNKIVNKLSNEFLKNNKLLKKGHRILVVRGQFENL